MDTRKWTPKAGSNEAGIEDARTGRKPAETKMAPSSVTVGGAGKPGPGVPMDNMGNSPSNPGAEQADVTQALSVDNLPDVPPSGSEFNGDDRLERVAPADKEIREKTDHASTSSAVIQSGIGEISKDNEAFTKARIPMSKAMHNDLFTNNTGGIESDDADKQAQKADKDFRKGSKK